MIIRGDRPSDRFSLVANAAAEDVRLSLKARGLLLYLLSRPPGWRTSVERLAASVSERDGRDAIRTGLQELEALGYLRRVRGRDEAGKWVHFQYVTDEPLDYPSSDNPPADEPPLGDRDDSSKTDVTRRTTTNTPRSRAGTAARGPRSAQDAIPGVEPPSVPGVPFAAFWEAYPGPRRRDRARCEAKWNSLTAEHRARALDALGRDARSSDWTKQNGQFIPAPLVWLNRKRWLDDDASSPAVSARALVRNRGSVI